MASDGHLHRRHRSANNIPLQDLDQNGGVRDDARGRADDPTSGESHRRTFSERIAGLALGSRGERYRPLDRDDRSPSPPVRTSRSQNPLAIVTSPTGQHLTILEDDEDSSLSPSVDPGAFQSAIGFAGLSINVVPSSASSDDDASEPERPPTPTPIARANRTSLPSLRTERDSMDDMMSVQLDDGPIFSPAMMEDDTEPLTDSARLQPGSSSRLPSTPQGQRHDRRTVSGIRRNGALSGLSVRFSAEPPRTASMSRLGDDLPSLETGSHGHRPSLSITTSPRRIGLSPPTESPLARTGTMLRKISQRVVNVSNEEVDALVERSIRRKSVLRRPSTATAPSDDDIEEVADYRGNGVDGAVSPRAGASMEKSPRLTTTPSPIPTELPKIDRNPLRGKSLGLFPPESAVRRSLLSFLVHPLWEPFILLLIIAQTVILAIDAANNVYKHPRPTGWGVAWTDFALLAIFIIYTLEMAIKIVVSGFLFNAREYSTIDRSIGVRQAMAKKANDLFALHRKHSTKSYQSPIGGLGDGPSSLLHSFTTPSFDEVPGGSRQAQKKRLAHRAFLRHSFNRVDFVAVICFWTSFVLEVFHLETQDKIWVFRMMSSLRILRLLGITGGTSVILRSLKRAAPTLLNVAILIGFFWLLFAVIGVQCFKSSLRRTCVFDGPLAFPAEQSNYTLNYVGGNGNEQYCGGWLAHNGSMMPWLHGNGAWGADKHKGFLCPVGSYCVEGVNPYNGTISFDNILQSLELVFVVMSTNTFSDIMYDLCDTDYLAAALYFAFGIVLLTFWLINLLIAVITSSFQVIREESRSSAFMAQDSQDMYEDGTDGDVQLKPSKRKKSGLKRFLNASMWFFNLVILYGLVVNCLRHATMGHKLKTFIDVSETIVSLTLLGEMVIRFLADWRGFAHQRANWFDLALAIITTVIEIPSIRHAYGGEAYAWLTVFQILRVYRLVLAISITRDLVMLVLKHVSGILNLILFVFLLTFLAAIFAAQLFRGTVPMEQPSGVAIQSTFMTIWNSFLSMYQILSSENWTDVLFNVTASNISYHTSWIGATFVVLWFIFANFITLNMFIAVIQENFDVSEDQKRMQQVRMFLQRKDLGNNFQGTLSLSTIFKFGRVNRADPLDYGSAATDMLLKEGIVKDFLDEELGEDVDGVSVRPTLKAANTFDILQSAKGSFAHRIFIKLKDKIYNREPNPFYQHLHFTKAHEELDPRILAQEVVEASERRKVTQREYLRRHPKYNVSLFLFKPQNPIRHFCQRIVGPGRGGIRIEGLGPNLTVWYSFSAFIYVAIVAMVTLACIATPLYQERYFSTHSYTRYNWFILTDIGFAGVFTIEAIIKVIADGFFWTPNAYFRSSWGSIDGIVLLTLWINVVTSLYDPLNGSRAVGAFKALRALRLLNVSDSARDTFHSVIILGGWKVVSAAFVSLSLLIPFAIYGLNLFAGKMMFCNEQNGDGNPIGPMHSLTDCVNEYYAQNYNWTFPMPRAARNSYYDFDSFGGSLFILFQIASQEGWVDVMWSAQSITGVFTQPSNFASQANAVFFVVFNLLGAVFVLTLFVSVFMRNYTEQTGVAFLTTEQRSWLELRKLLRQVAPSKRPNTGRRREGWQAWCYRRAVTKNGWWHRTITVLLCCHLVLLCLEWYPEPAAWTQLRTYLFLALTLVYVANITIRIVGLSWTRFRKSAWDVVSLLTVGGALIATILFFIFPTKRHYIQAHKLFLVSVALLLIPRYNQLDQLFKTAAASLNQVANLLATWFVLFIVFAIAMTQTFGLTRFYWHETGNVNFRTVPKALIVLFRMSVGENWNELMEDYGRVVYPFCNESDSYLHGDCGSATWAKFLFIAWNILSMYIFVNLFISLIYESFSYVYQRSTGLNVISREEIRRFKQAWAEFDPNGNGYITKEQFPKFLGELSGVFEMRIYDGDYSVRSLVEDCKVTPKRMSTLPVENLPPGPYEIDLKKLNRRLQELPVSQIRRRRQRMNAFYEEVLVSADPDRGISFNGLLMILAHYKVINDNKSLRLEEFLRRRARLQRVEEAVNRQIVVGFFDTLYWSRQFRRLREGRINARMTAIPNIDIPEIFVQGEDSDTGSPGRPGIPSVAVTPVDFEHDSHAAQPFGIGRATSSSSSAAQSHESMYATTPRDRSSSIQQSPQSPSPLRLSDTQSTHLDTTRHRPSPSASSIQPEWHFAASLGSGSAASLTPPGSPGLPPEEAGTRSRAHSAVSQNDMLGMLSDSAWGESMRRSVTQKRSSDRDRRS